MSLLLLQKERMVLKDSKILKEHKILQEFLKKTPNLKKRQLSELPKEQVNFMKYILPKVLREAHKEWVVDKSSIEYTMENHMKCELCGHRPIKKVCIIENKFTKTRLRIGTECVTNFGDQKDIDIDYLIEESKKIQFLDMINRAYPGIERIIADWDYFINKQEILVKNELTKDYWKYGEDAKNLLEEYTNTKTLINRRKKILKEIGIILEKKDKEMEKIEKYVSLNKSNLLIPKRDLVNKIQISGQWKTLDMLREDGIIRHRTLYRINDEEFSKSLVKKINNEMKNIKCKVTSVIKDKKVAYIYNYQGKSLIKLLCSHEDFFFSFYNFITGDEGDNLNLKDLINMSKVYSEESIENFLYDLFSIVEKDGFRLGEIYNQYNDFYLYDKSNKKYYKFNLTHILEKFKLDLFLGDKNIRQKLLDEIKDSSNKIISVEDYKDIKDIRYKS